MAATTHQKDQRPIAGCAAQIARSRRRLGRRPKYMRNALYLNTGTGAARGRLPRRHGGDGLDLVRAPRGPGQRRAAGPLRDQRHDRERQCRPVAAHARREPRGAHQDLEHASPVLAETAPRVPEPGGPAVRGRSAAWGLEPEGRQLRRGLRGPRAGTATWTSSTPTTRGGSRSCATTATRATASTSSCAARFEPLRGGSDGEDRERPRASRCASSSSPAGTCRAASRSCISASGEDTVIRRMVVTWPSGHVQTFKNLAVDRRYTVTEPSPPVAPPRLAPPPPGQFAEVSRRDGPLAGVPRGLPSTRPICSSLLCRCARTGADPPSRWATWTARAGTTSSSAARPSIRCASCCRRGAGQLRGRGRARVAPSVPLDDGPVLLFDAAGNGRGGPAGDQGRQRACRRARRNTSPGSS